jgi:hypothetical protein
MHMSFGHQKARKPADMTIEGWVTQQTDLVRTLVESKHGRLKAHRILLDLADDILYDGLPKLNPCAEIPLPPCDEISLPFSEKDA